MKLTDTCKCGARFEVEASGACDVRHTWQDWIKAHSVCRERETVTLSPELESERFEAERRELDAKLREKLP